MDKQKIETFAKRLKDVGIKTAAALRDLLDTTEINTDPVTGARGMLNSLFDNGTFSEVGTFVRCRPDELDSDDADFESVITGWGAINGRLVYAFAQDISKSSGAVSEAHARKICELYRLAMQNGAPIVGIFDSAGASVLEGVRALAGYGRIMKASSNASGVIPQIAVASGYASGAAAVICGMFDILITTEKSEVSVNHNTSVEGAGAAEEVKNNGTGAVCVPDEESAIASVKEILNLLPSNNAEGAPTELSRDDVNKQVTLDTYKASKDAHDLIKCIADDGKYIELYSGYACEMVTALASVGGNAVCFVATNKSVNGGSLSAKASRKASRAVSLADSFNLPVVTLVDSIGYHKSAESEDSPYLTELAKLAAAYASASSPLVTVIVGEAYGTAFTILGSKSLGSDLVLSLDSAKIAAMNASSAVAFLWNDKISEDVTREDLERQWNDSFANPVEAASLGEIDDIIVDSELRQRLCAALYMLSAKSVDTASKRHLIMPL